MLQPVLSSILAAPLERSGFKGTLLQQALAAIRRLGGTLIYAPDNALGDGAPNLLTAPEDFAAAAWVKTEMTVATSAEPAPDGTIATKVIPSANSNSHHIGQVGTAISTPHTDSVYLKFAGVRYVQIAAMSATNQYLNIDLQVGVISATGAGVISSSISALEGGWYRVSVQYAQTGSTLLRLAAIPAPDSTWLSSGYTGDGVSGVYIWGAKLEVGSVATAYTPQSVLRQRGVYVDNTGTTPVTAVADLIGLITDKSYGGALGVELVTNGDFSAGSTGWLTSTGAGTSANISGGVASISTPDGTAVSIYAFPITPISVGKTYRVQYELTAVTGGGVRVDLGGVQGAAQTTTGLKSQIVTVTNASASLTFARAAVAACSGSIDNISVREVPGNHATQSAVASKPSLQRVPKRLGPNLVVNGDFSAGATGWTTPGSGVSISVGKLTGTTDVGSNLFAISSGMPVVAGKSYQLIWDVDSRGPGSSGVHIYNPGYDVTMNPAVDATLGTRRHVFTAKTTGNMTFQVVGGGSSSVGTFDNFQVCEVLEWANVISFDGNNDFLQTGITTGNEGWVCAGVSLNSLAANQVVLSSGAQAAGDPGLSLKIRSTGAVWAGRANASTVDICASPSSTVAVNTPCVIDADYTTAGATVRKDGVVVATSTATVTAFASVNPLRIGAVAGASPTEYLSAALYAKAYTPTLPSAADRDIIRKGIAALQGRTL